MQLHASTGSAPGPSGIDAAAAGSAAGEADTTRARILAAAEQLFAARGIAGVSLREINRASGARNAVAVQYHFTDRAGVVRSIVAKHRGAVESARHALLDQHEASDGDLRALSAALVRPLSTKLADPDGGAAYLQIYAELVNGPQSAPAPHEDDGDSIQRWRHMVEPFLAEDATRLHRRFTAIRFAAAELGRRARSGPHRDDRLFTSHLIDLVTALLVAPTSSETLRAADARDASRRGRRRRDPQL